MRPSQQIQLARNGKLDQCDDAVRSLYRLTIYNHAVRVLELPFNQRKKKIDSSDYPDMLGAEVKRIYKLRGLK